METPKFINISKIYKKTEKISIADGELCYFTCDGKIRVARDGEWVDIGEVEVENEYMNEGGDDMRYEIKYDARKFMEHTRMRFDTMGIAALWLRMGKTTNPSKLAAFSVVAEERGHMDLAIAAKARLAQVTGDNSVMDIQSVNAKPKPKKNKESERLLRKLDI